MKLETLFHPLSAADFFARHWEKDCFFSPPSRARSFRRLFSLRDVDAVLSLTGLEGEDSFRILKAERRRQIHYPHADRTGIHRFYDAYNRGYTIIINAMQLRWRPVAAFAARLQASLHHPVGVNLYLTPPGSQGFLPHFDDHDVFILQIEGRKKWRLYDAPQELPLAGAALSPEERTAARRPRRQFVLEPGSLLYIPRGQIHDAVASDQASIHLTVGIHVFRYLDLLVETLKSAARRDVDLRRALPVGFLDGQALQAKAAGLLERIGLQDASALEKLAAGLRRGSDPVPDGHFASLQAAAQVDLETTVRRRGRMPCAVRSSPREAKIEFDGNHVSGPPAIGPALRYIARASRFRVRDLPDCLTDGGKTVLVRRLVREGLLSIHGGIT